MGRTYASTQTYTRLNVYIWYAQKIIRTSEILLSFNLDQRKINWFKFSKRAQNPRREFCVVLVFFCIQICVTVIYRKMFCQQIHFSNCILWFWFKNQNKFMFAMIVFIFLNQNPYIKLLLVNSEVTMRSLNFDRE